MGFPCMKDQKCSLNVNTTRLGAACKSYDVNALILERDVELAEQAIMIFSNISIYSHERYSLFINHDLKNILSICLLYCVLSSSVSSFRKL